MYKVHKTLIWGDPKINEVVEVRNGEPVKKSNVSVNIVGYEIANKAGKTIILTKDQAAAFVSKKGNGEIENAKIASRRGKSGETYYIQGKGKSLKDASYLFRVNNDDGTVKKGYEVFEKARTAKAAKAAKTGGPAELAKRANEMFKERGIKIDIPDF